MVTDVWGQIVGPISKDQSVQEEYTLPNSRCQQAAYVAQHRRGVKTLTTPRRKPAVLQKILLPVTRNEPRFLGFTATNLITDYAVPAP